MAILYTFTNLFMGDELRLLRYTLPIFLLFIPVPCTFGQSDSDRFAEGRVALEQHHDCAAALSALDSVSPAGRTNVLWIYYMAKANECAGNKSLALKFYRAYAQQVSAPEITDKIGELQYAINKEYSTFGPNIAGIWKATKHCDWYCDETLKATRAGAQVELYDADGKWEATLTWDGKGRFVHTKKIYLAQAYVDKCGGELPTETIWAELSEDGNTLTITRKGLAYATRCRIDNEPRVDTLVRQ